MSVSVKTGGDDAQFVRENQWFARHDHGMSQKASLNGAKTQAGSYPTLFLRTAERSLSHPRAIAVHPQWRRDGVK